MTIKNGQSRDTCNIGHKHRTMKKARRKIKRWATWTPSRNGSEPRSSWSVRSSCFFILVDANSTITKLGIISWNDIIYIAEHEVKGSGILFYVFLKKRLYKVCLSKHDLGEQIFILIRCYCENTLLIGTNFRGFWKVHWSMGSWVRGFVVFLFSCFKWTTQPTKIRTPISIMISQ